MDQEIVIHIDENAMVSAEDIDEAIKGLASAIAHDIMCGLTHGQIQLSDGYQIGSWEIQ